MNDVSAVAGQLARLRERLEQKESELGLLSSQTEDERNHSIQFIGKLMQACRGYNKELDTKLSRLRQRLENRIPFHAMLADTQEVERLLLQHGAQIEEMLRHGRDVVRDGVSLLHHSDELPDNVRRQVRELLNAPAADSLFTQQEQLHALLAIYQKTTSAQQAAASTSSDQSTPLDNPGYDEQLHGRLCDELQRLITELDFSGPVGDRLAELRRQLLAGVPFTVLPQICLNLIELIIEGARQERRESHLFLSNLNDSISSIHLRLGENLDEERSLHEQRKKNGAEFHRQLDHIGQQLETSQPQEQLKQNILMSLGLLQDLMLERNQHMEREKHLLDELTAMEQKVSLMKEETAEYKKRMAQQKHKLLLDSLTQVFNRAAFDERLELEYKRWLRYQTPLCLAIIDIDHFKSVNDRFGHLAGDKALKVIARAMSRTLRETDFIARYGGEEFVVLLPGVDEGSYLTPLEKIKNVVKNIPFRFKDDKVEITISIGVTLFRSGDSSMDVFERADQALYEAKNGGRNRIIYHP